MVVITWWFQALKVICFTFNIYITSGKMTSRECCIKVVNPAKFITLRTQTTQEATSRADYKVEGNFASSE